MQTLKGIQRKHHGRQINPWTDLFEECFYSFLIYFREMSCNGMWNWRNVKFLLGFYNSFNGVRYLSNKSVYITKIKRKMFLRVYPTLLVLHDGSTNTIRHFEPRRIIKLPLDISTVSEELRDEILERRKPKKKVVIEKEIDDNFDSSQYIQLIQRKKAVGKA